MQAAMQAAVPVLTPPTKLYVIARPLKNEPVIRWNRKENLLRFKNLRAHFQGVAKKMFELFTKGQRIKQ